MFRNVVRLTVVILFGVLPTILHAEYFSNLREGKGIEAQQASSKAFAGLAQVMTGLSTLEAASNDDAKTHLTTALTTIGEAASDFQLLAEKHATVALEIRHPDAVVELAQTLEVSADEIATVGDVWALTSQALNRTAKALEAFVGDPTMDKYSALRISIENTLRAGDLSSKLLE
jgi:hypothetical protein